MVIFAGHRVSTKIHSHHALEIIIPFDSDVTVEIDNIVCESKGILLKQDVEHATNSDGFVVFICISPESALGKRLKTILQRDNFLILKSQTIEQFKKYLNELIAHDHSEGDIISFMTNALIEDIAFVEENYTQDVRIRNVLEHILCNSNKPIQFKELLEIAFLSEGRLSHLFKNEIGIPIRKYILWCRIQQGIRYFLKGHTLTQAAYFAGFSDVSHLTRTFVSTFGLSPSLLLKNFSNKTERTTIGQLQ
jgi:AraC-like DNA-binding protein